MTRDEKNAAIRSAALKCYLTGVKPEIGPVMLFLLSRGNPFGRQWTFCFCVACDLADLQARAGGYRNQSHRAWETVKARHALEV